MENHKQFYITLFSDASQKVNARNKPSDFTIQLARRVDLGSIDDWEVSLCEFSCPPIRTGTFKNPHMVIGDKNALIYCDLITPQFVGNNYVRCLRTFIHPSEYCEHLFRHVYYVPVERRTFQDITIVISNLKGAPLDYKTDGAPVKVVLHFRRV